jgi:exo-1,4-beta-D-glucosaminidase
MKQASRPVHISVDYEKYLWNPGETFKADVYLLNDTLQPVKGYTYLLRLITIDGKLLAEKKGRAKAGANSSVIVDKIEYLVPETMKGKAFFVTVELSAPSGEKVSDAIYPIAVSTSDNTDDYQAVFSSLNEMPGVALKIESEGKSLFSGKDGEGEGTLKLSNPGENLAFYIRIRLQEESESLRTNYSDNYITLLPGETKTISIQLENSDINTLPDKLHFEVSGWNCLVQIVEWKVTRE